MHVESQLTWSTGGSRGWQILGAGAAVTLFSLPMTKLHFPPELLKEASGASCAHFFHSSHCICCCVCFSLCGLLTRTMVLFYLQFSWGERTLGWNSSQVRHGDLRIVIYDNVFTNSFLLFWEYCLLTSDFKSLQPMSQCSVWVRQWRF